MTASARGAGTYLRRLGLVALAVCAVTLAAAPAPAGAAADAAAGASGVLLRSPSGNIVCGIHFPNAWVASSGLFCQTYQPAANATLTARGRVRTCHGSRCVGDPGDNPVRTLRYGRHLSRYGFRCSSRRTGMTCVLIRTGHGFRIAVAGIRRV